MLCDKSERVIIHSDRAKFAQALFRTGMPEGKRPAVLKEPSVDEPHVAILSVAWPMKWRVCRGELFQRRFFCESCASRDKTETDFCGYPRKKKRKMNSGNFLLLERKGSQLFGWVICCERLICLDFTFSRWRHRRDYSRIKRFCNIHYDVINGDLRN